MIVCASSSEDDEPYDGELQTRVTKEISTSCPRHVDCPLSKQTWVAHLDVDSFYVAAELLRRPDLKGRCVAVSQYNSGGFVALSIEAKLAGLRKGDGVGDGGRRNIQHLIDNNHISMEEAHAKCKDVPGGPLEVLAMDTDYYLGVSWQIYHRLVKQLAMFSGGTVQKASYDDFYLDISSAVEHGLSTVGDLSLRGYIPKAAGVNMESLSKSDLVASDIAGKIKDDLASFGLQVTFGVGPNKLIARMASALAKPSLRGDAEGLALVPPRSAAAFVRYQPIASVCGLGAKLGTKVSEVLRVFGGTLGDIAAAPKEDIMKVLQSVPNDIVQRLFAASIGDCSSKVVASGAPKTTLAERSFPPTDQGEALSNIVIDLARQLLRRCAAPVHEFGRRVPRKLRISYRVGYSSAQGVLPSFTLGSVPQTFASAIVDGSVDNDRAVASIAESTVQALSKKLKSPWQLTRLMLTAFEFGDFLGNSRCNNMFSCSRNALQQDIAQVASTATNRKDKSHEAFMAVGEVPPKKDCADGDILQSRVHQSLEAKSVANKTKQTVGEKEQTFLAESELDASTFAELPAHLRQQIINEWDVNRFERSRAKTIGVDRAKRKATLDIWFPNSKGKTSKVADRSD